MGTAEVESALVAHPKVADPPSSAIRTAEGAGHLCLCHLMNGIEPSET